MKLLHQFIHTLNEDERQLVKTLSVRGKKKDVFELCFLPLDEAEQRAETLDISKTHLYEISSLLLQSCYELIMPDGGIDLLDILVTKNLPKHYRSVLRLIEKNKNYGNDLNYAEFALSVFYQLHRFSYNFYDWKLIDFYRTAYLKSLPEPHTEEELAFEAQALRSELLKVSIAEPSRSVKKKEQYFWRLCEIEAIAERTQHPFLCHNVYNSLQWCWQNIHKDPQRSLEYLQKMMPYAVKLNKKVFHREPTRIRLQLADTYSYLGKIDESIQEFKAVFAMAEPNSYLWKSYRYLLRYIETLAYAGNYEEAEAMLHKHFDTMLTGEPTSIMLSVTTLQTAIHLLNSNYTEAKKCLDHSISLNVKSNYSVYSEVRIRYLEACYYFLTGDWQYTPTLCNRALHYLRSKGLNLGENSFGYFFKIIEACIDLHTDGSPLSSELERRFIELTEPQEALFGKLITKIRNGEGLEKKKK